MEVRLKLLGEEFWDGKRGLGVSGFWGLEWQGGEEAYWSIVEEFGDAEGLKNKKCGGASEEKKNQSRLSIIAVCTMLSGLPTSIRVELMDVRRDASV